jgi:hypothetical protein
MFLIVTENKSGGPEPVLINVDHIVEVTPCHNDMCKITTIVRTIHIVESFKTVQETFKKYASLGGF